MSSTKSSRTDPAAAVAMVLCVLLGLVAVWVCLEAFEFFFVMKPFSSAQHASSDPRADRLTPPTPSSEPPSGGH